MQLDPSIITVAGSRTASAGLAYAVQRRAEVGELDLDAGTVVGTCRGSAGRMYSSEAFFDRDRRGALVYAGGDCSCPVGADCKHSVALYLTAFRDAPRTPPRAPARTPATPEWERALERIFPSRPETETVPLAIGIQFGPPGPTRWSPAPTRAEYANLHIRPLRIGKRGTWVQTGVSWRDFHYGPVSPAAGFMPEQARPMELLASFLLRNDPYASGGWHGLDRVDPTAFVLLGNAVRAGVQLVETARGNASAVLLEETADAVVDLTEREDGVRLTARIELPEEPVLSDVLAIGSPAVGVGGRDPAGVLTLMGLRFTASPEWEAVRLATGLRIPAADRERFERTVLPRIAARVGWRSSDRSFAPRPPAPPVLEVEIEIGEDLRSPIATVSLAWRYGSGAAASRLPLQPQPLDTAQRNGAAESDTRDRAAGVLAAIPALVDGAQPLQRSVLRGLDVPRLLTEVVPGLEALDDVDVVMRSATPEFRDLGEPEVRVGLTAGTDWFDLDVAVSVGGAAVATAELISALATGQDTLFLPDGGYVRLDLPELERLRELLEEARALTDQRSGGLRVSRLQLSWWEELLALGVVDEQERAWVEALQAAAAAPDTAPEIPEGLHAELRPYQLDGYGWLSRLRRAGLGGVLADDMGLGKTLQSLAMILDARTEDPAAGPFVVVAPTSVVPNWAAEAARFTPGLRVAAVTQTIARRGMPLAEYAEGADVVVTSYALFRLEYDDYAALAPSGLLLDEAQNVKNHQSKSFALAKQLPAPVKFAVTGTPMENNLGELWALFSIVAPGLLGSPKQFTEHYRTPIEQGGHPELLDRLRRRTAPFLLRRTKEQVATDLPSKQEQRIDVDLAPAHRRLYSRQLQRERQRVLGLVDDLDRNRIEVLSALTRLRQLAIDPSLVATGEDSAASSKLDILIPLLEEAAAEGHRTLVFSQFTRFLDRIESRLRGIGMDFVRLDGTTKKRADVVRSFAEGTQPVFLISLKAGGTGLNLTMADYCILTDPWWNPATEAQAVDRAHRIGQTRSVMVYRLIAKDTIEEKVMALQDRKRALVSDILGGGAGGGAISAADIVDLLG